MYSGSSHQNILNKLVGDSIVRAEDLLQLHKIPIVKISKDEVVDVTL